MTLKSHILFLLAPPSSASSQILSFSLSFLLTVLNIVLTVRGNRDGECVSDNTSVPHLELVAYEAFQKRLKSGFALP